MLSNYTFDALLQGQSIQSVEIERLLFNFKSILILIKGCGRKHVRIQTKYDISVILFPGRFWSQFLIFVLHKDDYKEYAPAFCVAPLSYYKNLDTWDVYQRVWNIIEKRSTPSPKICFKDGTFE